LGADLKNTITLVVDGQAFVSQHIGDLADYQSFRAFQETIDDLLSMYDIDRDDLLVACDLHPQYSSTAHAQSFPKALTVQHHRAHIASVLAERGEWSKRVLGVSFDGTGFGDDGTIWGGEFFIGSIEGGLGRVAHLRRALLPGGDAAAQYPVQAAAGFLAQVPDLPCLDAPPFSFPDRYRDARTLIDKGVRTFTTTSAGRLFDAAAALLGFTREISFEGQAAMWLEQTARTVTSADAYPFPLENGELDFRPLLRAVAIDRANGRSLGEIARGFQRGVGQGLAAAIVSLCEVHRTDTAVLSGGVFQNELLLEDLRELLAGTPIAIWTNHEVPANDGGISLGQAALAAFSNDNSPTSETRHA
jgi:hydrogenase maturation protein HypF